MSYCFESQTVFFLHNLPSVTFRNPTQRGTQAYLHGKALVAAGDGAAEGLLALVVAQDVTLHVEVAGELLLTADPGARQPPLLPGVRAQLVQVQEPAVVEELLARFALHLGCKTSDGRHQVYAVQ